MSFSPYTTYKDSGVVWLGEVPTHWRVEKLKFFARFVGGGTPSKENDEYWTGHIPWVSPKDMKRSRIDDTADKITMAALADCACSLIEPGAILTVVRSGILQHTIPVAINDVPVTVNQDMKALILNERVENRFLAYQVQGCQAHLLDEWVKQGATVESIEHQRMADTRFAFPPRGEQHLIADYLDTETARIDALIREKEGLVRLLGERRSGVFETLLSETAISLDGQPSSRFLWLRVVPSTWTCLRVKHIVQSFDQGISPQCEARVPDEHEWGVLKVGCVNSGVFNAKESKALPSEIDPIPEITLHEGDVLVSRANTKNLVGRAAMADKPYPRLMLSDKLYRLKLDRSRCNPAFLVGFLTLPAIRVRIEERATGASASMLNIDRRTILELDLPLPPIDQQKAIVMAADRESAEIRDLSAHVTAEITLLKELRAATIADAVLGRVDVRTHSATPA